MHFGRTAERNAERKRQQRHAAASSLSRGRLFTHQAVLARMEKNREHYMESGRLDLYPRQVYGGPANSAAKLPCCLCGERTIVSSLCVARAGKKVYVCTAPGGCCLSQLTAEAHASFVEQTWPRAREIFASGSREEESSFGRLPRELVDLIVALYASNETVA